MQHLFNPGPVNLSERVRNAMLQPDLCHREAEFTELLEELRERLLRLYDLDPERWRAAVLTGSGTAAVEAMLTSLVPTGGRVLVICNGAYGERMRSILCSHDLPHLSLEHGWEEAISLEKLEQTLQCHPELSHVALVQHETTIGRLNDLAAVGALCRARGLPLLVDAVSSFGAEALDPEGWGLAACASSSNKCLHGTPGLGLVLVSHAAATGLQKSRHYYLNLRRYLESPDARAGPPFTPAVHCCYALREALAELEEYGGWAARRELYRYRARQLRAGLSATGFNPIVPDAEAAASLTAFPLRGMAYQTLHAGLKAEGLIIYAAQGGLAERMFRVGVMGELPDTALQRLVHRTGELYAQRA